MSNLIVRFHETAEDGLIEFAVIVSRHNGRWVFCMHRERRTFEIPGGHREKGERILDTARRELYEETGATDFELFPISAYSVTGANDADASAGATYGMLYFADIKHMGRLPESEIKQVALFDEMPANLTYPSIQPKLMEKVKSTLRNRPNGAPAGSHDDLPSLS